MPEQLEQLYQEARSALKAKDYDRASGLLRQILQIDENYKDASRLLAQTVQLRRRRWYNDPRLWGVLGTAVIIGLGIWLVPKISLPADQLPTPTVISPTITSSPTALPITATSTATVTPLPTPTSVPLRWKRISLGQEFARDKVVNFVIDPKDSDILYVRMENAGYYWSIDGGISWQPVQEKDISITILSALGDEANSDFEVSNKGSDGRIRRYRHEIGNRWFILQDGHWRQFADAPGIRGNWTGFSFTPSGDMYVYCGENICKFDPDAEEMKILGKPGVGTGVTIRISSKDPNIIYASGSGMAVTNDGGYTWIKLNNGLGGNKTQLIMGADSQPILYLLLGECNNGWEGLEQPLYRSVDNGATWKLLGYRGCFLIKDADGETFYRIATDKDYDGRFYWQLSNKGLRWDKISIPSAITTLAAHPTQNGVLYAYDGNEPTNQYISENYGYTWKKDSSRSVNRCYGSTMRFIDKYRPMAIDPFEGDHVFIVIDGTLYESHDSCQLVSVLDSAPNTSVNSIVFDTNTPETLYAGTDEGVYVSFDSGESWGEINEGLLGATVVYSIVMDKDSNVYAATPYGIFKLEGK